MRNPIQGEESPADTAQLTVAESGCDPGLLASKLSVLLAQIPAVIPDPPGVPKSQASSWPAHGVHLSRMYPMAELQLTAQVSELVSQVHPSKPCWYSTPPLTTLWGGLQPQRVLPGGAGRTHQRLTLQPAPGCSS